ncbi:MAG: Holliday junction branch migration protein RuvA [Lachnospiraceae bacterium]|nr:Holliday junction branch migration protein RuvA [Lachnospiraceae bacterium]
MIRFLKGIVEEINIDEVVLEVAGIGYCLKVPSSVIDSVRITGMEVKLHTYMNVREDGVSLFGFLTKDDLEIFKKVISVSGIGPKGGLAILSTLGADGVRFAVLSNDAKAIAKTPGIGPKMASKLILELKDKIDLEDAFNSGAKVASGGNLNNIVNNEVTQDATEALIALGYSSSDVLKAISKIDITEDTSVQDIIKQALRIVGTF